MLPMRDQLMRGLVGADLLGFHTSEYMRHFLQSAQRIMGNDASATFAANTLSLRIPRALGPAGATATAGSMAPGGLAEEAELPAPAVATPTATPLQPPLTAELVDAVNAAADTAEVAADVGAHDFAHTVHTGAFPIVRKRRCQPPALRSLRPPWPLAPGPWPLAPGPWALAPGPWPLAPDPWALLPGVRRLRADEPVGSVRHPSVGRASTPSGSRST